MKMLRMLMLAALLGSAAGLATAEDKKAPDATTKAAPFLALEGWEDRSRAAQNWTYAAFPGPESLAALPLDRAQPLPAAALPLMLTFDDITDPATLRLVDPADLAASFGPGVRLVSATLAITKARVTEGIIPGLPFWPKAKSAETLTGLPAYGTAAYPPILQTLPPTALKRD